jgi:hypothetical protein
VQLARPFDWADSARFTTFAVVGFALTGALAKTVAERSSVIRKVLVRIVVLAILLEAAQIFLISHACGVLDILIAAAGALAGSGIALMLIQAGVIRAEDARIARSGPPTLSPPWRAAAFGALAFAIVCAAGPSAWAGASAGHANGPEIRWIPFQTHFLAPFSVAVVKLAVSLGLYAFVTLLCLLLTRGRGRATAILLLIAMTSANELYGALFAGQIADITPVLLAIVAWLIACRTWWAIYPPAPASSGPSRFRPSSPKAISDTEPGGERDRPALQTSTP